MGCGSSSVADASTLAESEQKCKQVFQVEEDEASVKRVKIKKLQVELGIPKNVYTELFLAKLDTDGSGDLCYHEFVTSMVRNFKGCSDLQRHHQMFCFRLFEHELQDGMDNEVKLSKQQIFDTIKNSIERDLTETVAWNDKRSGELHTLLREMCMTLPDLVDSAKFAHMGKKYAILFAPCYELWRVVSVYSTMCVQVLDAYGWDETKPPDRNVALEKEEKKRAERVSRVQVRRASLMVGEQLPELKSPLKTPSGGSLVTSPFVSPRDENDPMLNQSILSRSSGGSSNGSKETKGLRRASLYRPSGNAPGGRAAKRKSLAVKSQNLGRPSGGGGSSFKASEATKAGDLTRKRRASTSSDGGSDAGSLSSTSPHGTPRASPSNGMFSSIMNMKSFSRKSFEGLSSAADQPKPVRKPGMASGPGPGKRRSTYVYKNTNDKATGGRRSTMYAI